MKAPHFCGAFSHTIIGTLMTTTSPIMKNEWFAMNTFGGDYGTRTCDLMRVKHAL